MPDSSGPAVAVVGAGLRGTAYALEKPMATTEADAERVVAAAERARLTSSVVTLAPPTPHADGRGSRPDAPDARRDGAVSRSGAVPAPRAARQRR